MNLTIIHLSFLQFHQTVEKLIAKLRKFESVKTKGLY